MLGIPRQTMLRSIAKYALTDITVDFAEGTDIYWARQQIAERLHDRFGLLSGGGVGLQQVKAVVIEGDSPRQVLLGMNVLGQFEIDQRENLLILRSKF